MDWVEQRFKCSVEQVWTLLCETIRSDVRRWRELSKQAGNPQGNSPTITTEDHRLGIAFGPSRFVTLEKTSNHISVRRPIVEGLVIKPDDISTFQVVPIMNRDGECRLRLNNEEMEIWQVSRNILEPLLFP